ncbi:hypothetical protein CEP53_002929 [Fusarium sp. AF-6]|nr:hypothetical protein CEP53_002929 [Fusarium sp. AF-6]
MLRRNSSRNKNRRPLTRSKSTSSVVRNPVHALESMNPVTAERDAHIAALLSYHRAQERPSVEMLVAPRDSTIFFSDGIDGTTSMARQSLERSSSVTSRQCTATSVRFAGPAASRPPRTLALRASESQPSPTKATSQINVFGNTSTRPLSTMSFHTDLPAHYSLPRRSLESPQPPDACYSPEEDAHLMPLSFSKLRKSPSMLMSSRETIGNTSSYSMPAKGRLPPTHSLYKAPNNENEPPKSDTSDATGLRASTSMSFLKNRRGMAASRSSSRAENDVVVRLAREKYREQMEEQERLQVQSSATVRSKNRRSEGSTGLRKSLRNSSNNSTVLSSAFSSNGTSVFKQQGLRKTARKVSNGLRSKLKGLFTRGKSVSGSEKHERDQGTDGNDSDGDTCLHASNDEGAEEASMFRVSSHIPSMHGTTSNQQLRSRKGSFESIENAEQQVSDDRSRVTSWTNSVTNTVSSTEMLGEWERQRLSVIKENGMHISSSSARPTGLDGREAGSQDIWSGTAIDSERVYSALMKRLGEISPQQKSIQAKLHADDPPLISVPDRDSSTQRTGFLQRTASTIRCVGVDDDVFHDREDRSSFTSSRSCERVAVDLTDPQSAAATLTCDTATDLAAGDDRGTQSEGGRTGVISAREHPKTTMLRSSAFFASPTCHSFRSPSPYRRALRENLESSPESEHMGLAGTKYLHSLSALSLPTRRNSTGSDRDTQLGDAESVYSCATEDLRPMVTGPGASGTVEGAATSMTGGLPSCRLVQHQRDASAASSVEWKTWLSSKVSKLEGPSTPTKADAYGQDTSILPPLGHVREGAEVGSPPEILLPKSDGLANRSPLSCVEGNAQPVQDKQTQPLSFWKGLAGHDENRSPNAVQTSKSRPPSIPPRSTLRTVPSLPIVSSTSDMNGMSLSNEVHRMRSLNITGRLSSTPEEAMAKRRSRPRFTGWQGSPTKSSPGIGHTTEIQASRSIAGSPTKRSGRPSNSTPKLQLGREKLGQTATGMGSGLEAQGMGSKTMVDIFLSSRQKETNDGDGSGLGSSPAAFL